MADGFIIERSDDGSTGWAEVDRVPSETLAYTDTGQTGTKFYRVKSYSGNVISDPSNVAGAAARAARVAGPLVGGQPIAGLTQGGLAA